MIYKLIRKSNGSVIGVHINSKEKVQISYSHDHTDEPPFLERVFPVGKENAAAVLHNGWLVECTGEETTVLCTQRSASGQCIRFSFERGEAVIGVTSGSGKYSFSNVQSLEILEQQIRIAQHEAETKEENAEQCNESEAPAISCEGVEDIIPMALHLAALREKDKIIEDLNSRFRQQVDDNRKLQDVMRGNLEDIIRIINDDLRILSEEEVEVAQRIMAKKQDRDELHRVIEEKEAEISAVELEILSLRRTREEKSTQLIKKNGIRDVLELDCKQLSQLKTDMDALILQLSLDRETIEALEDTTDLSNNRLQDTLEDICRKIEAVEKRIGQIVHLHEALAGSINAAVLNRDGLNGWILLDNLRKGYQTGENLTDAD